MLVLQGYCFSGECPTMEEQCVSLWGHGARPSQPECFEKYNVMGNQQGNCGENKYKFGSGSEFKKCSIR